MAKSTIIILLVFLETILIAGFIFYYNFFTFSVGENNIVSDTKEDNMEEKKLGSENVEIETKEDEAIVEDEDEIKEDKKDTGVNEAEESQDNSALDIEDKVEVEIDKEEVGADENKDTDSDGLTDAEEKCLGTKIKNKDTDGDGYPDLDEIENDYNPLKASPGDNFTVAQKAEAAKCLAN